MPRARCNGIEIEYETRGAAGGYPLLLVRGLGTQLIQWDERFCSRLVETGHHVVLFDNRDVGLSTHFHAAGTPDLAKILAARTSGSVPDVAYSLDEMAGDLVGVMDALGIDSAHVAGMSMGGMIAQQAAILFPRRLRSLTSIMSTTGEPGLPGPTPEAGLALSTPPPRDRAAYIDYSARTQRSFSGRGFAFDEAGWRVLAGRVFDRCFDPAGIARQMAAVVASGSRREALAGVTTPTLVLHGSDDPLIPPAGGEATARAIPGARFHRIEGMGHDLPEGAWPEIVSRITDHTTAVESARRVRTGN